MRLGEFLHWWVEQLAASLPSWVHAKFARQRTTLQADWTPEGYQLHLHHKGQTDKVGNLTDTMPEVLSEKLATLPAFEQLKLVLPAEHYLRREVELPLAAESNLTETIGYQIDTLTPFRQDQVWFFCGVQQRLPQQKKLRAWLVAVPRRIVAQLEDHGIDVQSLSAHPPLQMPGEGAVLALSFQADASPLKWSSPGMLLVGGNLVLLLLAVSLHLHNLQTELDALQTENRRLNKEAIVASDLLMEISSLEQTNSRLHAQYDEQPSSLAILEEISRRLDDQTWLQSLEIQSGQLRLQGFSSHAARLTSLLEDSPLVSDVQFSAALVRNPNGGDERFNLVANLQPVPPANTEQQP